MKTPACALHWLDGVVGAAGFTSVATSSAAVVANRAAAAEAVAPVHAGVAAVVVAVHEAVAASVIPSSGRICAKEREDRVI